MSDPGARRATSSAIPAMPSSTPRAHWTSGASAAAVAILLMLPTPPGALPLAGAWSLLPPLDKLVHFVLFLFAAWPWWRSFRALGMARPGLVTVSFATVYAGLLEVAQGALTATRTAEWGDLLAGALGALAGVVGVAGVGAVRLARRAAARIDAGG